MNKLALLVAAGAAYFLLRKAQNFKTANFTFHNVKFQGGKLQIQLAVTNPSPSQFKIQSLQGTVSLDDKQVSTVNSNELQIIAPNSTSILTFNVQPTLLGIADVIRNLFKKQRFKKIAFNGTAFAEGFSIPVNLEKVI